MNMTLRTRRYRTEWLVLGIALLTLGAIFGFSLSMEFSRIDSLQRDRLQVQARVVDENLARQLEGVSHAMAGVRDEFLPWEGKSKEREASLHLRALAGAIPGLRTIGIFDAQGITLASSRDELIGRDFSEREFFKIVRANPNPDTLHVSPPFHTALGAFSINVTRAVIGSRGEFAGVVTTTLAPEYFSVLLKSVLYATGMRASLIHGDGKIVVEEPNRKDLVGMDLAKAGSNYTRHVESAQAANLFTGAVFTTGERRMSAWRTIRPPHLRMDKPLFISVNRDMAGIFATWRRDAYVQSGLFGVLLLASTMGLAFYQRRRMAQDSLEEKYETERKRTEAELRSLSRAVEQSPASIVITDRDGNIEYVNPRFEEVTGYSRAEALGKNPRILKSGITPQKIYQDLWKAISQGGEWRGELCNRRKDGELFWEYAAISGLRMENGEIANYIAVKEEITERKRLEEMHLQAQKLESLGTLAGGIAHDFNNILAAIKGNVDLAAEDVGPDHLAAESLDEIRKASERAAELVRRITTFARPKETRHEEVDLGAVVDEVLKLLRSTLPAGILLRKEFAKNTSHVLADAGQIHEAIVNLTTNAVHAIGPRAGTIEYRLEAVEVRPEQSQDIPGLHSGRYLCLTVTDSGCGMDAATMERIFDVFYTTKPLGEGTGLGLSMVHGIMKSHGGAVTVESSPGKGSSFRLYFPAAGGTKPEAMQKLANEALPVPAQRVLYVDDEEALVSIGQRVLSRLGHRVRGFTEPMQALAAFRASPQDFDIVVTDLSMPHLSGFDLAREVLALRPGIPVLMTSGHIREEDENRAREAGIRELMLKPFTVEELGRVIDRILKNPD